MPTSRNRKNQKKKSQQRTDKLNASRKKEVAEYLKKLEEGQKPPPSESPYNQNEMKNPYQLNR